MPPVLVVRTQVESHGVSVKKLLSSCIYKSGDCVCAGTHLRSWALLTCSFHLEDLAHLFLSCWGTFLWPSYVARNFQREQGKLENSYSEKAESSWFDIPYSNFFLFSAHFAFEIFIYTPLYVISPTAVWFCAMTPQKVKVIYDWLQILFLYPLVCYLGHSKWLMSTGIPCLLPRV